MKTELNSSQQREPVRFGRWFDAGPFQPLHDKCIDGVSGTIPVAQQWRLQPTNRLEGPVRAVRGGEVGRV